ncbi:MAG: choice-of-anchor A family protein, partial [Roseiflexaceae bacterium]
GTGLANSNGTRDDLIVGGDLDFNSGAVLNGNIVYAGKAKLKSVVIPHGTARKVSDPLALASTQSYVAAVAARWAALPSNGSTSVNFYGGKTAVITLVGNDPTRNVFTLAGANLAKANKLEISAPASSIVVINIDGTKDAMEAFGIILSGVDSQHVVYNFYKATKLTMKKIGVLGTVWAPFADVSFSSGAINGTLLAKSFKGSNTEFKIAQFAGPLP